MKKAMVSWLCDPYLHLLGVGAIVVTIGMGSGSRTSQAEAAERCELCQRAHDESKPCPRVVATAPQPGGLR